MIPGMGRLSRPPPPSLSTAKSQRKKINKNIRQHAYLQKKLEEKIKRKQKKLDKQKSGQPSLIGKIKSIFTCLKDNNITNLPDDI
jgi:septal ring factor EnvC (AmiA/AmiB activator)